jgi:hypothetical protein
MYRQIKTLLFHNNNNNKLRLLKSINSFKTSSSIKYENRNLLKLKERGLVVGIFPDQM